MLTLYLALLLQTAAPVPDFVLPWLGVYEAAPEKITLSWDGDLHLQMDQIGLPVDGRWHETFATYGVRQRATFVVERGVIRLDEQHNYQALEPDDESGWQFELRLDNGGSTLLKLVRQPGDSEMVLRRYQRTKGEP